MSGHTAGPWSLGYSDQCGRCVAANDGYVAVVHYWSRDEAEKEANAALIADAPAMRLALDLIAAGVAEIVDYGGGSIRFFVGKDSMIKRPADTWTATINAIGWDRAVAALEAARGGE